VTRVGVVRHRYNRTVEPRPSRFSPEYRAWTRRADAWGRHLALQLTLPEDGGADAG
jgi:hypothetical protein